MKKLIILAFLFSFSVFSFSQKDSITVKSITAYSGRGVLSEGVVLETTFQRGRDIIVLSLGERDLYAFYGKSLVGGKIVAGPCLEYFQNIPILGGIILTSPLKNISTFTWSGFSAGNPGEKANLADWKFLFVYQNLEWQIKRFTLSGAIMYYQQEWAPIAEIRYTQPINKNIDLFTGIGYKFIDGGIPLLRLGGMYKF